MTYLILLYRQCRIKHWIKNFLIFVPLFFSGDIFVKQYIVNSCIGFLSFSFMSSAIYIINDLNDLNIDRCNPYKKKRPLAAGEMSKSTAIILVFILIFFGLMLSSTFFSLKAIMIYFIYLIINILYSVFHFKNIPVLDVCILASGFLIRVLYGSAINNIITSQWMFLVILFGALYLGMSKRYGELKMNIENIGKRKVIQYYSKEYLLQNMYMSITVSIIFYSFWCLENSLNAGILWSIPLLVFIVLKYSYNIMKKDSTADPIETFQNDKGLIFLAIIFIIYLFFIIY